MDPTLIATVEPAAQQAAEAVRLARVDSRRALDLAHAARAAEGGDAETEALVERALGLVATEACRMVDAVRHLRRAVRLANRAGDPTLVAEARLDLAAALALRGRLGEALSEAERAGEGLRGPVAARLMMRRALVLQRLGHHDEALAGYRQALVRLRRNGDREWEARLLCNRGVLHAFRGDLHAAESDLLRAEWLHDELGLDLAAAQVRHNLGFVAARRGDVPAALARYDRVDEEYRRVGVERAVLQLDRCEVLLSVNLVAEARRAAEQAVAELEGADLEADLAEARLILSDAALRDGDPAAARFQAEQARRAFVAQRRPSWAVVARYAALRAAWSAGERSPATLAAARRTSEGLAAARWDMAALDARLIAGRIALQQGRPNVARRELARAGRARGHGPVSLRTGAWHAEALLRHSSGNLRGAQSAVSAGLRVAEQHRAALGATELRAHASAHAADLAALGVRLALEAGSARRVLLAAERSRKGIWQLAPARPPDDGALAAELAELRRVLAEIQRGIAEGKGTADLLRRQRELEAAIRRRSRQARGQSAAARPSAIAIDALAGRLGDAALVEFVADEGQLHAVTLIDGRARLWPLGAEADAAVELATIGFALRRLALGHGSGASLQAFTGSAAEAVQRLDAHLLAPLRAALGDRPLVLVPTGALYATPWPALPSCAGRPVVVAPSAALWHRASLAAPAAPPPQEDVLLVAGPGLPGAAEEVRELAALYPRARCLSGDAATGAAVTGAFQRAVHAHVAAHGSFRTDNPLFSSLELADGPLTVYEIEALGHAPARLVLSACDSARAAVMVGDELLGLSSALFSLGTSTVVGSVVPVRDESARELMVAFHRRLAAGRSPAEALAEAQVELGAGTAFVCFGAG
jgi:tetratricopeptide (TPR) repeat protein